MDDKAQLPDGPFGTFTADFPKDEPLLACAWAARSLIDTLSGMESFATRPAVKMKPPRRGDKTRHSAAQKRADESHATLIRSLTMGFNRDMREVSLRIHQGYDQYARKFYEDTGVSVDDYVGTCWAEIALQLGRSVYFAMAVCTNPQSVLPGTINQAYVPLDPDSVVKSFDEVCVAVCQSFEGISKKGLKQLSVAMLNEHTKVHEKLFPASTNGPTPTTALTKTEAAKAKTEGAVSQGVFVYNGKQTDSIEPAPWGLLQFMEDKDEADIDEAYRHAIGDHAKDPTSSAIKSMLSKANNALLIVNHPKRLSKVKRVPKIIWA